MKKRALRSYLQRRKEQRERPKVTFDDLYIQTKGSEDEPPKLVKFRPNAPQVVFLDEFVPGWREGEIRLKGLQLVLLKARQFGFSTLIIALYFLLTVNNPNTNTVIMADDASNSEELFDKARTMWENLPQEKQPRRKYDNKKQLVFGDLRSKLSVLTAGNKRVGRSRTIHNLHCSEAAFYHNKKLLTGLLQAVPAGGNAILESTANGEAGDGEVFCTEYRKARDGQSKYRARFYPWHGHDEYEKPVPAGFTRDAAETTIVNQYRLDQVYGVERANRKLEWRRQKIAEPGMGTLFPQEYPGSDEEAFLVSGTRYFHCWRESRHVVAPGDLVIEPWYRWIGGYDWGESNPAAFLLAYIDDYGDIVVVDEVYGAGRTDPVQAADVLACLQRWKLKPDDVPIYADPSMWANKKDNVGRIFSNISAFFDAGLYMLQASNARVPGWKNLLRYLSEETSRKDAQYPRLRVSRKCQNLVRVMPLQIRDDKAPEDMESDDTIVEDHAPDALRYLAQSRPLAAKKPVEDTVDVVALQRFYNQKQNQGKL